MSLFNHPKASLQIEDYDVQPADDIVEFLFGAQRTATLPPSARCSGANQFKLLVNRQGSSNALRIAPDPNTDDGLYGQDTVAPGQAVYAVATNSDAWYVIGAPVKASGAEALTAGLMMRSSSRQRRLLIAACR